MLGKQDRVISPLRIFLRGKSSPLPDLVATGKKLNMSHNNVEPLEMCVLCTILHWFGPSTVTTAENIRMYICTASGPV